MKKVNLSGVTPVIRNRPFLGRFITVGYLLVMILLVIPMCFWDGGKEVLPDFLEAFKKMLGVIFLPWEDEDGL